MVEARLAIAMGENVISDIDREIERLLGSRIAQAQSHGPHIRELWELAVAHVRGGKLLRPRLLIGLFDAMCSAETAESRPAALEIAAALEILHYSFLLHDDVIDEDLFRRGKLNLIGHLAQQPGCEPSNSPSDSEFRQRMHWARSAGILVGDLMLTIAHQVFARVTTDEAQRLRMLDLLDAAVTETVAGEYSDVSLASGRLTPDLGLVLDMTRMKTAAYTFELPMRLAAVLAGADTRIEQQLGSIGRHLGMAFQLQDDLLSAFGESGAHGKDQFSDFRERKETVLMAYARMTNEWPSFEHLLSTEEFDDESGRLLQRLLTSCGASDFIESMIRDQIRAAMTILSEENGALPPPASRFILANIDVLEGRIV